MAITKDIDEWLDASRDMDYEKKDINHFASHLMKKYKLTKKQALSKIRMNVDEDWFDDIYCGEFGGVF